LTVDGDDDGGGDDDYCRRHVLIAIRATRSQTNKLCKFQLRQEIESNQNKIKSNRITTHVKAQNCTNGKANYEFSQSMPAICCSACFFVC